MMIVEIFLIVDQQQNQVIMRSPGHHALSHTPLLDDAWI